MPLKVCVVRGVFGWNSGRVVLKTVAVDVQISDLAESSGYPLEFAVE